MTLGDEYVGSSLAQLFCFHPGILICDPGAQNQS